MAYLQNSVEYLGLIQPGLGAFSNAQIGMTENCAVVIKDSALGPSRPLAIAEIEEILSNLFGCHTEIMVFENVPAACKGTNPLAEIPL